MSTDSDSPQLGSVGKTNAYLELLENIKALVLVTTQGGLEYHDREPRMACTALRFKSQLAHVLVTDLKKRIQKAYDVEVEIELDMGVDDKQLLVITVPRMDRIHWRCLESFSRVQLLTIVFGVLLILAAVFVLLPYGLHYITQNV